MRAIVSTFRKVSTKPDQAQIVAADCYGESWSTDVVVPPSNQGGPALFFFYRAQAAGQFHFQGTTDAPIQDDQWHPGKYCLSSSGVGRAQTVRFRLVMDGFDGGPCNITIVPQQVLIDDLQVGTDPLCPS
jgi:hypothetical protein